MLLAPLKGLAKFKKINVSTYQAASGAGIAGLNELIQQTNQYATQTPLTSSFWKRQYIFNVFSHNSKITQNFYNEEEMKIVNETRKILSMDKLIINPTCVRVPTLTSHCLSVNVEFETPVVDTAVPPVLDATVPPLVDATVPPVVDASVPPIVDTPVPPPLDTPVDTTLPPPVDNNSNNPDVNTQPSSNHIGGYKRMQQRLFKDITNVITVKLTVYNNNFKNSFIKKIRYSQ
jgi:aspartate-semialdehyde dehydrogenase